MEIQEILELFCKRRPKKYEVKNTSHGDSDFREVILAEWDKEILPERFHDKLVIKLADNGFMDEEHIRMWKRCSDEYRALGYYCPAILPAEDGTYPWIQYQGRRCIAYAEEFATYESAEQVGDEAVTKDGVYTYIDDAILMNAKVAAEHFNYTRLPSTYCMFEKFDPNDVEDEVMENALMWRRIAKGLPVEFQEQVDRIWERWKLDRSKLEKIYPKLPRSVFQADINNSNCLLDGQKKFCGVYDFNLAGNDVFLNYLFREVPHVMTNKDFTAADGEDYVVSSIMRAIKVSKRVYTFSSEEKKAALLMYRCLKPLWFTEHTALQEAAKKDAQTENADKIHVQIQKCLDRTEYIQTREIDFANVMEG